MCQAIHYYLWQHHGVNSPIAPHIIDTTPAGAKRQVQENLRTLAAGQGPENLRCQPHTMGFVRADDYGNLHCKMPGARIAEPDRWKTQDLKVVYGSTWPRFHELVPNRLQGIYCCVNGTFMLDFRSEVIYRVKLDVDGGASQRTGGTLNTRYQRFTFGFARDTYDTTGELWAGSGSAGGSPLRILAYAGFQVNDPWLCWPIIVSQHNT